MRARVIGVSTLVLLDAMIPLMAYAQTPAAYATGGILGLLSLAARILNILVGLFILAAVVVFFWGLIKYLLSGAGENKSDGIQRMIWGLVAIFVMVSIWGLIRILQATVGVDSNTTVPLPQGIQPRGL